MIGRLRRLWNRIQSRIAADGASPSMNLAALLADESGRVGRPISEHPTPIGATVHGRLQGVRMSAMSLQDRINSYVEKTGFPRSVFLSQDGRLVGTWIMGNDFRVRSGYCGGYPAGYLRRIKALFPDKTRVLHLFSGKVDLSALPGDTVDLNADFAPTYVDDGQTLESVPLDQYDLVLADPPYSVEDAERYQTTMVKRNVVMHALQRLNPGAYIVWLDQVLPMYRKDVFDMVGVIGIVKSTNHRFRVVTIFRRRELSLRPLADRLDPLAR